jgi:hypothetical protein
MHIIVIWTLFYKTAVGIVISIIVIGTPFHKSSVGIVIYLHTIPENLNSPPILQTVYAEVLWNGVQMTIIDI